MTLCTDLLLLSVPFILENKNRIPSFPNLQYIFHTFFVIFKGENALKQIRKSIYKKESKQQQSRNELCILKSTFNNIGIFKEWQEQKPSCRTRAHMSCAIDSSSDLRLWGEVRNMSER